MNELEQIINRINQLEKKCNLLSEKCYVLEKKNRIYQHMFDAYVTNHIFQDIDDEVQYVWDIIENSQNIITNGLDEHVVSMLQIAFKNKIKTFPYKSEFIDFDLLCLWTKKPCYETTRLLTEFGRAKGHILFLEEGFLEAVVPPNLPNTDIRYKQNHSFIVDNIGLYFDARNPSTLENILNSDFVLTTKQEKEARQLIERIVSNRLSKYNHQPIAACRIGSKKKKLLIVDQVWGDASIAGGLANDDTFQEMLSAARKENPEYDILIKTHPVSNATKRKRHFDENESGIYWIDYDINPIYLLECVDKVYVCTSQMGFEALMCGKEVHTFGVPFYSGWGLTMDRKRCKRRMRTRSLEDVFYIAYVMSTTYISYRTQSICSIHEVIDELLDLREEYNQQKRLQT